MTVTSNPSHAHVAVHDDAGREVADFHTPGVAKLKRSRKYFMPARYTATIEAPGYETAEVPIRSTANPWLLGNVALGGVVSLAVDGATGAAWKPRPSEIHRDLVPYQQDAGVGGQ